MGVRLNPVTIVPTINSTAADWIMFHKAMKKANYGKATVNSLWLKVWNLRGCAGVMCSANTADLRDYVASQGIKIEGGVFSFVPDAIDDWSDTTSKFFNIGLYSAIAVLVIIIGFLGMLAYNIGRNPQMVVDAGKAYAGVRTGGLAA
jgi:hypothetical protein